MAILTFTWPSQNISIPGVATEATLQGVLTELQAINIDTNGLATETTLSSINTKTPALVSGRVPVDGSGVTQPISAASLPLAPDAATETEQLVSNTRLFNIESALLAGIAVTGPLTDAELRATAVPISASNLDIRDLVFASDKVDVSGSLIDVQATNLDIRDLVFASDKVDVSGSTVTANAGTGTFAVSAASLPLPADAATETTLSALNTKVPSNLTVTSTRLLVDGSGVTQPISVASLPTTSGRTKVAILRNDYSSVNVTTGAYVQLTASTSATINKLQIFDSSGQTLVLAVGAAASEVDQIYIFPGGNGDVELTVASGARLSIKAVSATANAGEILINCLS